MRTSFLTSGFILTTSSFCWGAQVPSATAPEDIPHELVAMPDRWQEAMDDFGVPGMAVVVVRGDDVIYRGAFGVRDPQTQLPVTADTTFFITSCTKTFTAMGILQLAERGKIDLDAPVKKYLPRFQIAEAELSRRVTIRDLLSHAKGIRSDPIVFLSAYTGQITEDRFYHHLRDAEAVGEFGYQSLHYTLLGRVISATSGTSWKEFLAENIFRPAGMKTATCYANEMYRRENVAFPTVLDEGGVRRSTVQKTDATMHAAGGIGASINDLGEWLRLNLNGGRVGKAQILSPAGIKTMQAIEAKSDGRGFGVPNRTNLGYGLGWFIGTHKQLPFVDHGGSFTGACAAISLMPEEKIGVAVVSNSSVPLPHIVTGEIYDLLLNLESDDLLPTFKTMIGRRHARNAARRAEYGVNPAEQEGGLSLPPDAYVGAYENNDWGTIVIEHKDGKLVGNFGAMKLRLGSFGTDRFRYVTENDRPERARFRIESKSRVVAVILDRLNDRKPVRFDRKSKP